MPSPNASELSAHDSLEVLRQRVLGTTSTVLAVAMPAISILIWVQGGPSPITFGLGLFTLCFPLLRLSLARLGFRPAALSLLILLGLTCFFVATRGGAAVGNVGLSLFVVMLSALFFGRVGALCGCVGVLLAFTLAGALVLSGQLPPLDARMWDANGARFWVRSSVVLLIVALVVALTMTYVVDRLSRHAEERARTQAALEESRRVETLARLSGGIAHDFNNALTVIIGAADSARVLSSDPEAIRCLDDVLSAAQGAGELTRELLTLGRRRVSKPEAVPVEPLLKRLQSSIRRVLPSDIHLEVKSETPELCVLVDPAQLERSLYNLLLNARDAMPRGGRLTIRSRRQPDRPFVSISVEDTGDGMSQETLSHIFEPFFTTKEIGKGTGLGLASVRAFATQAGGDVRVVSEPGNGSTFSLELPEHQATIADETRSEPRNERPRHLGKRVLIVEDRADVRASMVRTLRHGGFTVTEASDGDSAIASLRDPRGFALLCIDGVMPGVSTASVLARARELDPGLPVLLCSGHVEEDLLRRGIETGRYAYLEKPFSGRELLDKVHGLLSSQGALRAPGTS